MPPTYSNYEVPILSTYSGFNACPTVRENPNYVAIATHIINCPRLCPTTPWFHVSVMAARDSENLRQSIDLLKANLLRIVNSLPASHPQITITPIEDLLNLSPRRFISSPPAIRMCCSWCGTQYKTSGYPKGSFIRSLTSTTLRCIYCPRQCQSCMNDIGHSAEFDNVSTGVRALLRTLCLPCAIQAHALYGPPMLTRSAVKRTVRRLRGE